MTQLLFMFVCLCCTLCNDCHSNNKCLCNQLNHLMLWWYDISHVTKGLSTLVMPFELLNWLCTDMMYINCGLNWFNVH